MELGRVAAFPLFGDVQAGVTSRSRRIAWVNGDLTFPDTPTAMAALSQVRDQALASGRFEMHPVQGFNDEVADLVLRAAADQPRTHMELRVLDWDDHATLTVTCRDDRLSDLAFKDEDPEPTPPPRRPRLAAVAPIPSGACSDPGQRAAIVTNYEALRRARVDSFMALDGYNLQVVRWNMKIVREAGAQTGNQALKLAETALREARGPSQIEAMVQLGSLVVEAAADEPDGAAACRVAVDSLTLIDGQVAGMDGRWGAIHAALAAEAKRLRVTLVQP